MKLLRRILLWGFGAERMQFRETRTIALIASPKLDAETLSEELRERIGGDEPIAVEALQIAPLMEAHLDGEPAFEVTPLTPAQQPVSRASPTEWRWDVQAVEAGRHALHLTMNAIITISTGQRLGIFLDDNWHGSPARSSFPWWCGTGPIGKSAASRVTVRNADGQSDRHPGLRAPE